jgi:N4-gp56 family major capsid protein
LDRGTPYLVFEKFGQTKPIPANSTQAIVFRRYFLETAAIGLVSAVPPHQLQAWQTDPIMDYTPFNYYEGVGNQMNPALKVLQEGITPIATNLASEDVAAQLVQLGDRIMITDHIFDTHEDPVLRECVDILGEQAAFLVERVRYNVLVGGSNVFFANGANRAAVNTTMSLNLQRSITRQLKRNLAKPITRVVRSTAAFGTEAIAPAYVAICHPDCEADLRTMPGFVSAENYGSMSPWEGEIGKVEDVRYVMSTVMGSFGAVGGVAPVNILNIAGAAIVYPILFLAKDAYGIVPLKGKSALTPMVVNPTPSDSDPLAQRGHVGWKTWQTAIILNDAWMARAEIAVSSLA